MCVFFFVLRNVGALLGRKRIYLGGFSRRLVLAYISDEQGGIENVFRLSKAWASWIFQALKASLPFVERARELAVRYGGSITSITSSLRLSPLHYAFFVHRASWALTRRRYRPRNSPRHGVCSDAQFHSWYALLTLGIARNSTGQQYKHQIWEPIKKIRTSEPKLLDS